jgi:acetyl-CoA synthetase
MPTTPDGKTLRRHGDQIQRLQSGNYCIVGRTDDTMNLGGIKISSAEIERAIKGLAGITETAAIAVNLANHGPSSLVIYAATTRDLDKNEVKKNMQSQINQHLNPLFKIYDVVFKAELPKTASNKIMRRILRDEYQARG